MRKRETFLLISLMQNKTRVCEKKHITFQIQGFYIMDLFKGSKPTYGNQYRVVTGKIPAFVFI